MRQELLTMDSKGWTGGIFLEFFTKILKRFGAYFKLFEHRCRFSGLGDDVTSGANARILYGRFRVVQESMG